MGPGYDPNILRPHYTKGSLGLGVLGLQRVIKERKKGV